MKVFYMLHMFLFGPRIDNFVWKIFVSALFMASLNLYFMTCVACAGSFAASKKAGPYFVEMQIDRSHPVIGENRIEIEIKDAAGRVVSDAGVMVNYYMPPMPRMAPMNYRTDAAFRGGKYRTTMNLIMEGPWYIAIKITLTGKTTTAKFNIDVK